MSVCISSSVIMGRDEDVGSLCRLFTGLPILHDSTAKFGFLQESAAWQFTRCCDKHEEFLLDCCLKRLVDQADVASRLTSHIVFTAHSAKRILIITREQHKRLTQDIADDLLRFIFKFWDFAISVVSYDCMDSFALLIDIHTTTSTECIGTGESRSCPRLGSVVKSLFEGDSSCRAVYRCIISLLKVRPSSCRSWMGEEYISSLYKRFDNASLGVVLSDLICQLLLLEFGSWQLHSIAFKFVLGYCRQNPSLHSIVMFWTWRSFSPNSQPGYSRLIIHSGSPHPSVEMLLVVSKHAIGAGGSGFSWNEFLTRPLMLRSLLSADSLIRQAAFSLLVEQPKRTQPLTVDECRLIGMFVEMNMTEQAPALRQKILAGCRKVFQRMAEVGERMLTKEEGRDPEVLSAYSTFVERVISLSFDSLNSDSNFPRRLAALSFLDLIFRQNVLNYENKNAFANSLPLLSWLTRERRLEKLTSSLEDDYEICQSISLDILSNLPTGCSLDLSGFLAHTKCLLLSLSTHVTLASGYRIRYLMRANLDRFLSLMTEWVFPRIEERLDLYEESLGKPISSPIHPLLSAIELILSELPAEAAERVVSSLPRLLRICHRAASLVAPVVHNMSPEGYLPAELMPLSSGDSEKHSTTPSQVLLACAWRAHKHVSAIFAFIVKHFSESPSLGVPSFRGIAEYFWLQLTQCKHCGAFESAVDGFEVLCSTLWGSTNEELPSPRKWLEEILQIVDESEEESASLVATRRSAGLPHLVCCILVTQPESTLRHSASLSFSPSLSLLLFPSPCLALSAVARLLDHDGKSLQARVHAFNILRLLFSSSRLAPRLEPALEMALVTAIGGCSSVEWPARNGATQLLAALLTRVFGVPRTGQKDIRPHPQNAMSAGEFFARFPLLRQFLLSCVRSKNCSEFSLFPALILLSHIFPSPASQDSLAAFVPSILKVSLSARSEKLRSVVALTSVSSREDILLLMDWLSKSELAKSPQNSLHSILLLMRESLIVSSGADHDRLRDRVAVILSDLSAKSAPSCWCDFNVNLFLLLCSELNVSVSASSLPLSQPHSLLLSLRPLSQLLLSNRILDQVDVGESPVLRQEMYRLLSMRFGYDISEKLLGWILADYCSTKKESDRIVMQDVLLKEARRLQSSEDLKKEALMVIDETLFQRRPRNEALSSPFPSSLPTRPGNTSPLAMKHAKVEKKGEQEGRDGQQAGSADKKETQRQVLIAEIDRKRIDNATQHDKSVAALRNCIQKGLSSMQGTSAEVEKTRMAARERERERSRRLGSLEMVSLTAISSLQGAFTLLSHQMEDVSLQGLPCCQPPVAQPSPLPASSPFPHSLRLKEESGLRALKVEISEDWSDSDMDWLQRVERADVQKVKELAIYLVSRPFSASSSSLPSLRRVLISFLSDEKNDIRERASSVLCSLRFGHALSLHPLLVRILLEMEEPAEVMPREPQNTQEDLALFEAVEDNIYEEPIIPSFFLYTKEFIHEKLFETLADSH